MNKNKKIYIADDEKNIRDLIQCFLENAGYEVEAFDNGDDLLEAFHKCAADMIILDIMMPGTDGLTVCREIRKIHNVPIIMVSARDSESDRITGITMGSDDYLSKPFSPMELVARVQAVFRRMALDRSEETVENLEFGDIVINTNSKEVKIKDQIVDLTPTEYALITYFISHKEKAISREELLKKVWKYDFEVDTRATDDTVKRLRKKLKDSNVKIAAVWGYGFRIELEENE